MLFKLALMILKGNFRDYSGKYKVDKKYLNLLFAYREIILLILQTLINCNLAHHRFGI